jgi:hypothetical protein
VLGEPARAGRLLVVLALERAGELRPLRFAGTDPAGVERVQVVGEVIEIVRAHGWVLLISDERPTGAWRTDQAN